MDSTSSRRPALAIGMVAAGYIVAAVALFRRTALAGYYDTQDYRALARLPLARAALWRGIKPPGYALVLKLSGDAPLARLQLALYLVSFLVLAWAVARPCRAPWLRVGCFAVVLLTSLSSGLFYWCKAISTESLSMSLLVLPLGLALWGSPRRRWARLAVAAIGWPSLTLWALMRDANVAWLAIVAALAALTAWRFGDAHQRRRSLVFVAIVAALVGVTALGVDGGRRWRFPLVNVIAHRVLPSPARTARFERAGMPDNAKVRCFKEQWASDCDSDFSGFEPWLTYHGKTTYVLDLLAHPDALWIEPLRHWRGLLCGRRSDEPSSPPLTWYSRAQPPGWQRRLSNGLLADSGWLALEAAIAALLVTLQRWRRRLDRASAPMLILLATVYPTMLVVFHGDAMEIQRHAIIIMLILRIGLWGTIALAVDRLRARSRLDEAPPAG